MSEQIGPRNLAILQDEVFHIPMSRPDGAFDAFLSDALGSFRRRIASFNGTLAKKLSSRAERIEGLCVALLEAFHKASSGDRDGASAQLEIGLRAIRDDLVSMSRRHTERVLPGQSWYRLASWGAQTREDMFHAPFEMAQKSYRFSAPGRPAIYLGNSVYLCWLECGQPERSKCVVSRFEIDTHGFDFLDLPCNHLAYLTPLDLPELPGFEPDPRQLMNSPYLHSVVDELAEYLTVWPLLAAVSVRKHAEVPDPPEYTLPQLLMLWVAKQDSIMGIRYFTSKADFSTNSQDWAVNLALPSRITRESGYCPFLTDRSRLTVPQPLAKMDDIPVKLLVTKEAGDRRTNASGKYMLQWPDGNMEHYVGTAFGKMEYWLDRDTMDLAAVQNGSMS